MKGGGFFTVFWALKIRNFMPPSSSGLGRHPFKVEITSSNLVGGTSRRHEISGSRISNPPKRQERKCGDKVETCPPSASAEGACRRGFPYTPQHVSLTMRRKLPKNFRTPDFFKRALKHKFAKLKHEITKSRRHPKEN